MALTHLDIQLLEFEQRHPGRSAAKATLVQHRLGMSPPYYLDRLRRLARTPAARARYPWLTTRFPDPAARHRAAR